jgi:radical SAM protein with 4Fe4S-binding SPASM domain
LNPFQPLYDQCNTGTNAGKYAALADFPKIIDVEVTSACNFRCLMCPTGNLSLKRPAGFMTPLTFLNIVDQCPEGTGIRFIGWGEPLLSPYLIGCVYRCNERGLLSHINTNGSKLTAAYTETLIANGLTSLKFSFQGVDRKSYAEMRNADFFDELLATARMVKELRGTRPYPYLHISTSITYEDGETVAAFRERAAQCADLVTVGHTTWDYFDSKAARLRPHELARLEELKALSTDKKRHPSPCPEVFDKLSVHYDGSVRVCCNDFDGITNLGNVNEAPLSEIWRHPQMEEYRKRLSANEYGGKLCGSCYDYAGLTEGNA